MRRLAAPGRPSGRRRRGAALRAKTREEALELEPWLTRDDFRRFKWIREAEREFQPFHQRTFFAAHPDLTFYVAQRRPAAHDLAVPARACSSG